MVERRVDLLGKRGFGVRYEEVFCYGVCLCENFKI